MRKGKKDLIYSFKYSYLRASTVYVFTGAELQDLTFFLVLSRDYNDPRCE